MKPTHILCPLTVSQEMTNSQPTDDWWLDNRRPTGFQGGETVLHFFHHFYTHLHLINDFYLNIQVAKNEELGLELVTLLNTKEKLQSDKEAVELETMQVLAIFTLFKLCFWNFSFYR